MEPNVGFHLQTKPGDYPVHRRPPFGWRDDTGKPIWAINSKGDPICGAKTLRYGTPCTAKGNLILDCGRCRFHGGLTPRGEEAGRYVDGHKSRHIMQRKAIIERFANYEMPNGKTLLDGAMEAVAHHVGANNLQAATYAIDQTAGKAESRITYTIENADVFEAFTDAMLALGMEQNTIDAVIDGANKKLTDDSAGSSGEGEG